MISTDKSKCVGPVCDGSCALPQYYKALNIRVALIGLEVWTNRDMINVSDNPHSTLAAFLSWRSKQLRALPNDNAQLITWAAPSFIRSDINAWSGSCPTDQNGNLIFVFAVWDSNRHRLYPSGHCPAGTNLQWAFVSPGGWPFRVQPSAWLSLKQCAPTISLVE